MQKKIYEGKSAILLLSGGQDSTTCLWWAKQAFDRVEAVGFDYGQRHARELECAARIAGLAGVDFHVVNLKGLLGGSSLTEHALDHSASHAINPDLPASFTAGRNALFLTLAASLRWALAPGWATDVQFLQADSVSRFRPSRVRVVTWLSGFFTVSTKPATL